MSRLSMSWLERHVEKIVLGLAGAVLVSVVVSYGIRSPHTVRLNGKTLGPKAFYEALDKRAEATLLALKDAPGPEPVPAPTFALAKAKPAELLTPFAPLNPRPPQLPDIGFANPGQLELASILPPTKPMLTTGKAAARIPPPREMPAMTATKRNNGQTTPTVAQDWHWVTVAATISRKAQRNAFVEANYDPYALELVVAEIEAQRQMRLPDGQWSPSEPVTPYSSFRPMSFREVPVDKDEFGHAISSAARDFIRAKREQLSKSNVQAEILRAAFQTCLADDRAEWTAPRTLEGADGTVVDLTDPTYGLCFPGNNWSTTAERTGDKPVNLSDLRKVREILDTGWKQAGVCTYINAVSLLWSVEEDQSVSPTLRRMARRILDDHDSEIQVASHLYRAAQKSQQSTGGLGPDVEPVWMTDTTPKPGKTYRYRLRLLALNPYAGLPRFLANPLDAGKVIAEGEWSAWSEAITVSPDRYLFVLGPADEAQKTVRVQLFQWSNGRWENGSTTVTVGEPITIKKGTTELTYDGVVRDIDFHRSYRESASDADGDAGATVVETVAVTTVTPDGETREHLAARDKKSRVSIIRRMQEAERRRRSADEQTQGTLTRA
jgi:hypothetical protein